MNNLKFKSIACILLLFHSIYASAQTFNITGITTGVTDGTWLYLRQASPEKILDSTKVMNGQFKLVGKTNEKIAQLAIFTANYTNYVFFWAEQNTHLQLQNGAFKNAIITGSKTQLESNRLAKLKLPTEKKLDSLTKLYENEKEESLKKQLRTQINITRSESQQIEIDYVKNNPNTINSAYILSVYCATWGKAKTAELYEKLSLEMKNTSYGKNIKQFIALNQEIKIGGKFADFIQTNKLGTKIKLSDIKAKFILLEFWGSWCGPCREENPNLVKTYLTYKNKGFEIFGVAADDKKEQWLKAIKDDQLPWENVSDLKGDKNEAALIYGISSYPTNFLIDENGIIIAKNLRGEALNKKLAELLP